MIREWRTPMRTHGTFSLLPIIITILTLADGLLHFRLDYALFGGKLWGAPSFGGPPPGIKIPQPIPFVSLPLNELFLLNFLGYVVLAFVSWLVLRLLPARLWIVDVVLNSVHPHVNYRLDAYWRAKSARAWVHCEGSRSGADSRSRHASVVARRTPEDEPSDGIKSSSLCSLHRSPVTTRNTPRNRGDVVA